jgi:hypothetical protein
MELMQPIKFPKKVYLGGADCFHLTLEINSKKHQIGNNVIRTVFTFENDDFLNDLINNVKQSPLINWFCNIALVKRSYFNKPYWKYENEGNKIKITNHTFNTEGQIPNELLNRKITLKNNCLIEFDVITYPSGKKALIISWHHIIMDARGSVMLIKHLSNPFEGTQKVVDDFFPKPEKRVGIIKNIKNMFEVKRFIETSMKKPITSIDTNHNVADKIFKIKTLNFNLQQTQTIDSLALKKGAKFGANVFLIAACAHLVNIINTKRNKAGTIWLPIPYDGRKRGGTGPIISNCISFLFYRLPQFDLQTIEQTITSINTQMMEQLKNDMPKKYNVLLNMMRNSPLKLYRYLLTRKSNGVVASFLYTSAGEDIWDTSKMMKNPISDVLIIPPFNYPPGLTFSFLRHNNLLKMNIVYCENSINENELNEMLKNINQYLLTHN